jgi:hypothetical protein
MYYIQFAEVLFYDFSEVDNALKIMASVPPHRSDLTPEFHVSRFRLLKRIIESLKEQNRLFSLAASVAVKMALYDWNICIRNQLLPREILLEELASLQDVATRISNFSSGT